MMLSKSALTTLKTILVIDLIIVAIAAPGYLYVNSLVPKAATFELTDLAIEPDWVQVGDPVQISVTVSNVGDKSGEQVVTLSIDDEPVATETVKLSGNESTILVFSPAELTEGEHTVTIEDLTGTLKITSEAPARPAKLELTNLGVSRAVAGVGETITVSVTATNTGDEAGEFTLELFVNDEKTETLTLQLGSKEFETVAFEVVGESEGNYVVGLGDLTTSFEIATTAEPAKPAEFEVKELEVVPLSVMSGEVVTVSVKVSNVGEETGSYSVDLKVDGATRETKEVTVSGGATQTVQFEVTEAASGAHNVEIGNLSGSFDVESSAPASENVEIKGVTVNPYEVSVGDTVTIKTTATNLVNEPGTLQVRVLLKPSGGEYGVKTTKGFDLVAGASNVTIELTVVAEAEGGFSVKLVNLGNEENTLSGYFKVVPEGMHTLSVGSYPILGIPFKLDGVEHKTPYTQLLPEGTYNFEVSPTYDSGKYIFIGWEDGSTVLTRTVTLDQRLSVSPDFSGGICCPSVYSWNGTGYSYIAEISNPGWLGYIGYITDDGTVVFVGGNPWDGVRLNTDQLKIREIDGNTYYDVTLTQKWDEIFYLDAAYLMVVDHPADVDVYSTIVRYINPYFTDTIYSVGEDLATPVSAVNEKGEDVLSYLSEIDGVFTPGVNGIASESLENGDWNRLTVDLGDLSDADKIKLLIKGMVDWGPADVYYERIDMFKAAAAEGLLPNGSTAISPPPYIEVLDQNGDWVRVPEDRQMPIPADYVARPFVVDLTGVFLTDNYLIRINNFWNVTFDYIGIDTTPQEELSIQRIDANAELRKTFETPSEAAGDFTRYGDVTELIRTEDDMFVIGMQSDEVALLFPVEDIAPPEEGTERTYFLFGACWFKDTATNWGYGFDFTVEPIPFRNMTGFPYTDAESYPYDDAHLAYIKEYNTRKIIAPSQLEPKPASFTTWASIVLLVMAVADLGVIVYYRKRNQ